MLQLVLAVCSILHAEGCRAEVLVVSPPENALPFEMMMGPQLEMAKWSREHPEWQIIRWALSRPSRFARS